jgi:hypothetical protein
MSCLVVVVAIWVIGAIIGVVGVQFFGMSSEDPSIYRLCVAFIIGFFVAKSDKLNDENKKIVKRIEKLEEWKW